MNKVYFFLAMLILFCAPIFAQQEEARLLRFPTVYGSTIVFSYAGDLYSVSTTGGTARKLTNDIGYEMFAHFSPDGKQIAFTAQYDGNTEVYVMPAQGGTPKRLTYTATLSRDDLSDRMGPNNIVMGWRDNEHIVYRSRAKQFNDWKGNLLVVSVNGGLSEMLPLPRGGFCSYSPDGTKLAYNRIFREFRTWKRYRGGMADEIWIYDFNTKQTIAITNDPASDLFPMWYNNTIYFASDRTGTLNLYSYDLALKQTKQLTTFTDFDVKFPSLGNNAIVFENGGFIYRYDIASGQYAKISIFLDEDFAIGRGGLTDVSRMISERALSPDGKRALFNARGEIFTVPAKYGETRNLTNTSGAHERSSEWSPDGTRIAFISDESGENEVYVMPQDGSGKPVQLTDDADTYYYSLLWSPDNTKILFNDRMQRLRIVDVDTKKITPVDRSEEWEIHSFSWSPDSKWVAYMKPESDKLQTLWIYSVAEDKTYQVTDGMYSSEYPAFSDDGKYLYLISDRNFSPTYSSTEWNHSYSNMAKLYVIPLAKDTKSPFEPKSDEVVLPKKGEDTKPGEEIKSEEPKKTTASVEVKIDFDGLGDRLIEIPVPGANYFNLYPSGSKIYYLRRSTAMPETKMYLYDFEKREETELGSANGFILSFDKKKMLVMQGGSTAIIDAPNSPFTLKDRLSVDDLSMNLDRKAEWMQIYNEAWRQMRDFFYDPNMHGVDWEAMRKKYEPLVQYVNHRADLTYIIGELIGELSVGHSYVGGGDYPRAERINLGLLGADLARDEKSGFYKITRIYKGANWDRALRSPLTEVGVSVNEGDYIIAVDGKLTSGMPDIYSSLVNKAEKQVVLRVNGSPSEQGSRDVTVVPIENEQDLLYYQWIETNRKKVNDATNGKVGYIHIPDMGVPGLNQFAKYYYPQVSKDALIIDVRGNGGGNISPMLIERLRRELVFVNISRNSVPGTNPGEMHLGPKVCLLDEFSASDGDIFPYRFRYYKLGTLIGKRSWGGTVGIRGSLPFVDGGFLNKPEYAKYTADGSDWAIEGYGVDPDIVVDNDPAQEYEGIDQQLNKAIEVIMEQLKTQKKELPPPPNYPDKSKK